MPTGNKPDARILAAIGVLHTAAAVLTWRDLRARSARRVRGDKRIWRVASTVNTLGSVAYWLFGRRQAPTASTGTNTREA
jgi:hypothetical protein